MARSIFISYRRSDSAGLTRAIYDRLTASLPSDDVYLDVETIAGGEDFRESVANAIAGADVLLVMIGSEWVSTSNDAGRRLDDPTDLVRIEVATALANGVRVVPVLLDGASMPVGADLPPDLAALSSRNAIEIRTTRFDADAIHLIRSLYDGKTGAARIAAAISVGSLAGATALILLVRPSIAFYAALITLALGAALAARFAAYNYARVAGRATSSALTVAVPLALFGGLVLTGTTLNRDVRAGQPFTLVVEAVTPTANLAGSVTLDAPAGSWRAELGPDGRAVFARLPAAALGDSGHIAVSAEGHEPADLSSILSADGIIRVELEQVEVATDVRGTVLDGSGQPMSGVVVDFGSGLGTDTTDARGNYRVVLPIAAGERTAVVAMLDDRIGYRDLVVVPSGTALTIRFRPEPD